MKDAKDIVTQYAMTLTRQIISEIDNMYRTGAGFGFLLVANGYYKLAEKLLAARGFGMSVVHSNEVGYTKYIIRPKDTEYIGE